MLRYEPAVMTPLWQPPQNVLWKPRPMDDRSTAPLWCVDNVQSMSKMQRQPPPADIAAASPLSGAFPVLFEDSVKRLEFVPRSPGWATAGGSKHASTRQKPGMPVADMSARTQGNWLSAEAKMA